jgi:protein disulfide-isomerase
MTATPKMTVEIWSDVMCPFCYIGKRHFEAALEQFPHKNDVDIVWKSFQLDPEMTSQPGKDVYEYLAERKGLSYDQSREMHENVVAMAKRAGLTYNFDKAVIANSFDAHRLVQFAKTRGLGDAAEEALFQAYFTDGKDVADHQTLADLAEKIGLNRQEAQTVLTSGAFADAVENDILEAQRLGLRGVPFFVMDRKYGVSGAQPAEAFLQTLNKAYEVWRKEHPVLEVQPAGGAVCTPEGDCD